MLNGSILLNTSFQEEPGNKRKFLLLGKLFIYGKKDALPLKKAKIN